MEATLNPSLPSIAQVRSQRRAEDFSEFLQLALMPEHNEDVRRDLASIADRLEFTDADVQRIQQTAAKLRENLAVGALQSKAQTDVSEAFQFWDDLRRKVLAECVASLTQLAIAERWLNAMRDRARITRDAAFEADRIRRDAPEVHAATMEMGADAKSLPAPPAQLTETMAEYLTAVKPETIEREFYHARKLFAGLYGGSQDIVLEAKRDYLAPLIKQIDKGKKQNL